MGNHDVGRGMAAAAKVFWIAIGDNGTTREQALLVLDAMAENYIGADAEFDDELSSDTDLSRLLCIAFDAKPEHILVLKGELEADEETIERAWDDYYNGPYSELESATASADHLPTIQGTRT